MYSVTNSPVVVGPVSSTVIVTFENPTGRIGLRLLPGGQGNTAGSPSSINGLKSRLALSFFSSKASFPPGNISKTVIALSPLTWSLIGSPGLSNRNPPSTPVCRCPPSSERFTPLGFSKITWRWRGSGRGLTTEISTELPLFSRSGSVVPFKDKKPRRWIRDKQNQMAQCINISARIVL